MDISYQTGGQRFNYRVCALFLKEGHILAMRDERSPYSYLPGGRVKLGETAEAAVLREVREELGIDARIVRPLWLNQAFFAEEVDGLRYHELCLYFLMEQERTGLWEKGPRFAGCERRHTHMFEWLAFEELEEAYFYPLFLKREIIFLPETLTLRTEVE